MNLDKLKNFREERNLLKEVAPKNLLFFCLRQKQVNIQLFHLSMFQASELPANLAKEIRLERIDFGARYFETVFAARPVDVTSFRPTRN